MRFCPFCSAENADESSHCATCARRLPPLPPRRQRTQGVAVEGVPRGDETATSAAPPPGRMLPPSPPRSSPPPSAVPVAPLPSPPSGPHRSLAAAANGLGPASLRRVPQQTQLRGTGAEARRASDVVAPAPVVVARTPARRDPSLLDEMTVVDGTDLLTDEPDGGESADDGPEPVPRPMPAQTSRAHSRASTAPPPTPPLPAPASMMSASTSASRPIALALPLPLPPVPEHGGRARPSGPERGPVPRDPTLPEPPPTRILRGDEQRDRPFTPPNVLPIPEVPESGLVAAARYALTFARARWQRAKAVKVLAEEIKQDTAALDIVLGTVGRLAREKKIANRVLEGENAALDAAEVKQRQVEQIATELAARQIDENARFAEIEAQRTTKVNDADSELGVARSEYNGLEAQRRSLRDKRKSLEARQKAYLKAATERDEEAGRAGLGDMRNQLRRAGEELRRDAAALDPERQDVERRVTALDKPIATVGAKVEGLKAELDGARRSLSDAREGHRHRLAELEAEQGRNTRELTQTQSEIQRRLVTLGTLVNLHRVDDRDFDELYTRIDRLREAIGARTAEIDRLTAERSAYDRAALVRGWVALGGAVVLLVTVVAIVLWIF